MNDYRRPKIDTSRPNPARMYDYFLGGKDNYAADREAAEKIIRIEPSALRVVLANRMFHNRAAAWMAGEGVTQFIDVGCGLPTNSNTHEVVQRIGPGAHVVYVDNDPVVITHARALLQDGGNTLAIEGDLRHAGSILGAPEVHRMIDPALPCGLLVTAVAHFVADEDDPWGNVARLIGALAPGSYLALTHFSADDLDAGAVKAGVDVYARASEHLYPRSRAEAERFFDGLEMVTIYPAMDTGVVRLGPWVTGSPYAPPGEVYPIWAGTGIRR